MTYSIKRLREEGHFCLRDLDSVESLDVFWAEANKVERLCIEDTGVFVAPEKTKIMQEEYSFVRCSRGCDSTTRSLVFAAERGDIDSLRSVVFRVLSLPEIDSHKLQIGDDYYSSPRNRLIFTPEQLRHIICAYPSRSYSFHCFSISPDQSVELVSHRKFDVNLYHCQFDDEGQAIIYWLENTRRETEILEACCFPGCNCNERILKFLNRAMYPVFDRLYFNGQDMPSRLSPLIAAASVNTLVVDIHFFLFDKDWREPLLKALRYGTFRPQNLEVSFLDGKYEYDNDTVLAIGKFLRKLLDAVSSPECSLKELHFKQFDLTLISLLFAMYLLDMLRTNTSLQVLGLFSDETPFVFPQMNILNAAAQHPRLRTLRFYPPPKRDPPILGRSEPFQVWLQRNRSHDIRFDDFSWPDRIVQRQKWQKAVFDIFTREFDALKQVEDERIRSYLLGTALATWHRMPDRIYYLLSGNQDVFAKETLGSCVS
jgi:hypothetical protein